MDSSNRWVVNVAAGLCLIASVCAQRRIPPEVGSEWPEGAEPLVERPCGGIPFRLHFAGIGRSPYITLTFQGKPKQFLIDYGATQSSISDDVLLDANSSIEGLPRGRIPASQFRRFHYHLFVHPEGGQFGILGLDILLKVSVEFDFSADPPVAYLSSTPCEDARLRSAGFSDVQSEGEDLESFRKALNGTPLLQARLGKMQFFAQLDSGYDDTEFLHSVDVNEALFDQMSLTSNLKKVKEIKINTCNGEDVREVYSAADPLEISFNGDKSAKLATVHLVRKPANTCGGIASVAFPAAQIGASVLAELKRIVVRHTDGRVWRKF